MAKYSYNIATVYGGFEYILFRNPSDAYPNGFRTLGGYTVLPGDVNSTAYTINKILRAVWIGVRLDLRDDLSLAGAYYHYWQNDYNTGACTDGGLSASSCPGTENAVSAMIDYRPVKRVDAYARGVYRRCRQTDERKRARVRAGCFSSRRAALTCPGSV